MRSYFSLKTNVTSKKDDMTSANLQPMIPPKHFDIFSPLTGRCSEGLDASRFFFKNKRNTKERRHDICKPNAREIQVRTTRG